MLFLIICLVSFNTIVFAGGSDEDEVVSSTPEELCKGADYQCAVCTYTYTGSSSSSFKSNVSTFVIKADGAGSGTFNVTLMNPKGSSIKNINSSLKYNDFLNDERNKIVCPKIAYATITECEEGDEDDCHNEMYLSLALGSSSDRVMEPNEYNNGLIYANENSKTNTASKTCMFFNRDNDHIMTANYDANTKEVTYKLANTTMSSLDAILDSRDENLKNNQSYIFGNKNCEDIVLYYKKEVVRLPEEEDYVDIKLYLDGKNGGKILYGISESSDLEKIKEELQEIKKKYKKDAAQLTGVLECNALFGGEIQKLLSNILSFIRYGGPLLMLLLTIVDLIKTATSGEEKDFKSVFTRFIKRFIAAALLFFITDIVKLLFLIVGLDYNCEIKVKN